MLDPSAGFFAYWFALGIELGDEDEDADGVVALRKPLRAIEMTLLNTLDGVHDYEGCVQLQRDYPDSSTLLRVFAPIVIYR